MIKNTLLSFWNRRLAVQRSDRRSRSLARNLSSFRLAAPSSSTVWPLRLL